MCVFKPFRGLDDVDELEVGGRVEDTAHVEQHLLRHVLAPRHGQVCTKEYFKHYVNQPSEIKKKYLAPKNVHTW